TGKKEAAAIKGLEKRHLQANISTEQSSTVAKGRVIRTNPPAFSSVQVGSRVDLVVSSGPEQVKVPGVVGKQQPEAKAALEDAGLKVTTVEQESDRPKREVLTQNPAAGTVVDRGSRVTITVSKGTQKVDVPDVTGRGKDEASGILQGAGFTVKVVEIDGTDSQVGKVIKQKPGGGSKRKKGSPVTIYVGKQASTGTGNGGGGTTPPPGQVTPPSGL
ncbi:MAG: eukaryotic-like serine/threonine-protein kinase, partial [Thermoleophilaceae bacterium]|nr:eukaryotic-like serine/threonine-protein kinase [Thermoleophilaceae bacterium]